MGRRATQWLLAIVLPALILGLLPTMVRGHGSMQSPVSRYYACYLEGPETPDSLACRDAIAMGGTQPLYDWNEVSIMTAAGRHKEIIPDGKLCSAGREKYAAFDVPRLDWATTIMPASGNYTWVYNAYVPHNAGYFEMYVTRDGWDPLQPLKWSDLEATPFSRFERPPLENGTYVMTGPVPAGKSGRHIIYTIWQRYDSAEAFYACSDVWFGSSPTPTPTQAPACTHPVWNATTIYAAGALVSYEGRFWRAKWSNSGTAPNSESQGNPWEIMGFCSIGGPTATTGPSVTLTSTRAPASSTPTRSATQPAGATQTPTSTNTSQPAVNLLLNPGFETDANGDGDPDSWTTHANVTRSNAARHGGTYAMRHFSTANANHVIAQVVGGITPGASYSFSGWTSIPATSDAFTYRLELVWRNSNNGAIRTDLIRSFSAATNGWVQTTGSRTAPANTTNVVVRMNVSSLNATIYADDFRLARATSNTPTPAQSATMTATGASTSTRTATTANRTATATQPATGCGSLAICDDFEGQSVGAAPGGSWQVLYPDCQGTGSLVVDGSIARSGAKSIRVDGQGGFCNHVFFGNTSSVAGIGPVVYARFYLRATSALTGDHVTFAALKDINDGNRDLRLGGQSQVVIWNRLSDDATVPELSPAGIALSRPLPTNQWTCVEFMLDGPNGAMQTWLDGVEVEGLRVDATDTANVDATWHRNANWHPSVTDLKLGWESYGGAANTLWFDDVAMGAQRIGCGGTPQPTRTATGGIQPSPTPTRAATVATPPPGALKVQYRAGEAAANTSQIKPHLNIVNSGSSSVPLTELKVRYWYTKEGTAGEQYFCDYAVAGCGNVKGAFGTANGVSYLEVSFSGGTLAANGQTGEIQNRVAKTDWSSYTQTGDYSFDGTKTAFADWNKVTLYRNGILVWGTEP